MKENTMKDFVALPSLDGLRLFAVLGIVLGHVLETLWIDDGNEDIKWLSVDACTALRRSAEDLVAFVLCPTRVQFFE